jgi:uncharacterized membrane protein
MQCCVHIFHFKNLQQILFEFGVEGFCQQLSDNFNVVFMVFMVLIPVVWLYKDIY